MILILSPNPVFDIGIPDSFLYDVSSDLDKSLKLFHLSRTLSIFRVRNIYIYHDKIINPDKKTIELISTILEYLDTPQYLRKKIYPKMDFLKYAGKFHPLRTPHHRDKIPLRDIKTGETRIGIVEKKGNNYYVDVGLDSLISYRGNIKLIGKKINVKLIKNKNFVFGTDIDHKEIQEIYWGYNILYKNSLNEVFKGNESSNIILTSRYSKYFDWNELQKSNNIKNPNPVLIIFGSPKYGLDQIFKKENIDISKYSSFNFFPYQGTRTIRLEESIFGVLSILNLCLFS